MHCYGHALNLAVADYMKSSKIYKDTSNTSFEITKLIIFSPKRNAAFDQIRVSNQDDKCTLIMITLLEFILFAILDGLSVVMPLRVFSSATVHCLISGRSVWTHQ